MVEVIATQGRVSAGGNHFEDTRMQAQQRDVEGSSAQVVDGVQALHPLVQAIGKRGGRGFVDQAQHMQARKLREARVEAERMLLATASALNADGDLLSDDERQAIAALEAALRTQAQSEDADAITNAVEALAKGTEGFAAARMNRGIQQALTGRSIDSV